MSYKLEHNESIQTGLRRIAGEQLDRALSELDSDTLGPHEKALAVRKRCKKVRGLVRLVRPAFDGYGAENRRLRDAARTLAGLRDAAAVLDCYEKLIADHPEPGNWARVHAELIDRRDRAASADVQERLESFRSDLLAIRERAQGWSLDVSGFDAIRGGIRKTYARARKAMTLAYEERSTEMFHEWRKCIKYDRYHTRLLADAWQQAGESRYTEAKLLSDLLGAEHDLSELRLTIEGGPKDLIALIRTRQTELRLRAHELGKLLYADTPGEHTRRIERLFMDWYAGELAPQSGAND